MNLIGQLAIHKKYGGGTIISMEDGYITVRFIEGEKKFPYPEVFKQFLKIKDEDCMSYVKDEIAVFDAKAAELAEQKRLQLEREKKQIVESLEKKAKKVKSTPRDNIAFKCNYCDGGKSSEQVGFNGICSDAVIYNNIEIEKRTWCCDELSACLQYHNGEIDRTSLEEQNTNDDFVCYESQMLRDWRALAGIVRRGERKGEPMKFKNVQNNSLCILTTRDPNSSETDRYIFALFLVDETYEGSDFAEGCVSTRSKYKIKFSSAEAHKMLFWNYHANDNNAEIAVWSSGLHRYVDDIEAVQILQDMVLLKKGTKDATLAEEFLSYFVKVNGLESRTIPPKNGALIQAYSK